MPSVAYPAAPLWWSTCACFLYDDRVTVTVTWAANPLRHPSFATLSATPSAIPSATLTSLQRFCHTISVFFNPAASDVVQEAAIKDILDKLTRGAELLQTGAIPVTVLHPQLSGSLSRITRRLGLP